MLSAMTLEPDARPAAPALLVQISVSQLMGVELARLRSRTRGDTRAALARHTAMYLCHLVFGMSLTEVGLAFGRDRTTACHAWQRIEDLREDGEFDRMLSLLEDSLAGAGEPA